MPSFSPAPPERPYDEHELDTYAGVGESSRPLLNGSPDPGSLQSASSSTSTSASGRRPARRGSNTTRAVMRRWWKPLVALSTPFLFLLIYSAVHPHVPGLPPLPKVSIHSGYESPHVPGRLDLIGAEEDVCRCGETDAGQRLCDVYQREGLRLSRAVEVTGARVRRVLQKAREGEKLKVGILGGSGESAVPANVDVHLDWRGLARSESAAPLIAVSACHGLHPSPTFPQGDPLGPGCYTSLVGQWLKDTFPGAEHEVHNGAIGGMDSSYYAFCGTHHIALDTDLIILEFDVNDQPDLAYQTFFDQLLRVLLEFKSQPAVVILGAWSPQVALDLGYADPQIIHTPIAQFRDVPYVSMKRLVFNTFLRFPQSIVKSFFQPDMLHPNARGHRILADLLISYFETELCKLAHWGLPIVPNFDDTISTSHAFSDLVSVPFALDTLHLVDPFTAPEGWEKSFEQEPLNRLTGELRHFVLPTTPYEISQVSMFTPLRDVVDPKASDPKTPSHILNLPQPEMYCADANDEKNPMKPTSFDGWEPFVWNREKHFWVTDTVGARIRVEIKVNAGRVAVYYYRSQHYDLGDALCWVDDNEKGAVRLPGYWDKQYNVAVVAYIDEKVTPGDHYVTCELSKHTSHPTNPKAHHWRLVAVMAT